MTYMFSKGLTAVALAGALVAGVACSDDDESPTGPSVSQVAGRYIATSLTATSPLGTQDVLQAGGSLTMQLTTAGAVTGHVSVPSQAVDEDFAGTWRIDDGRIELDGIAGDLFVEDMEFNVVGNTLVGDETFNGVRVQATLTKQ